MFKNMNKGTKTFVVVYAVCWIISAITCAVMYFKWFSEARELQKRANAVIERDIFKECFDNLQSVGSRMSKYMPSGSEWDDLPDVNDEESFTKWLKTYQTRSHLLKSVCSKHTMMSKIVNTMRAMMSYIKLVII